MLFLTTLAPEALGLLRRIQSQPAFRETRLVGGAALATRKDFVDVYFLLQRFSLEELLGWYSAKYPDGNAYLVLRSLVYFDDAEIEPMPNMLQPLDWAVVKESIETAVKTYAK